MLASLREKINLQVHVPYSSEISICKTKGRVKQTFYNLEVVVLIQLY